MNFHKNINFSDKPLLTATEPTRTIYKGQSAELRCESSGINPSSIRWTKDSRRVPQNAIPRANVLR